MTGSVLLHTSISLRPSGHCQPNGGHYVSNVQPVCHTYTVKYNVIVRNNLHVVVYCDNVRVLYYDVRIVHYDIQCVYENIHSVHYFLKTFFF